METTPNKRHEELLKTSQDLRALAFQKQPKYEDIIERLNHQAKNGITFGNFPELPQEIVFRLVKEGFTISNFTDPMGVEFFKVKF